MRSILDLVFTFRKIPLVFTDSSLLINKMGTINTAPGNIRDEGIVPGPAGERGAREKRSPTPTHHVEHPPRLQ